MQKNVLSANVEYSNGKRITTETTETITSLADDRAVLANYYGTLAALQSQLEQIENAQIEPSQKAAFDGEAARIKSEMQIVEQAIEVQNKHIKGFDNNEV